MTTKKQGDEPAKDIAPVQDVVGTLVRREGDAIGRYLAREMESAAIDPEAVYSAIIAEIMAADSSDELFDLPEPGNWEDHLDQPLELSGFKLLDSEFETGAPVYFVVGGIDLQTGKKVIITSGEQAIMAQLLRAKEMNLYPIKVTPRQASRPNRFGRHPIRLHRIG